MRLVHLRQCEGSAIRCLSNRLAQTLSDKGVDSLEILGGAGAVEEILVVSPGHGLCELGVLPGFRRDYVPTDSDKVVIDKYLATKDSRTKVPLRVCAE